MLRAAISIRCALSKHYSFPLTPRYAPESMVRRLSKSNRLSDILKSHKLHPNIVQEPFLSTPIRSYSISRRLRRGLVKNEKKEEEKAKEVSAIFEEWLVKHGKVYNGSEEKEKRFQIFKDNLRYINEQNTRNHSYRLGLNQFADMTLDELADKYLTKNVHGKEFL
ncbi:P34 probable thiol protease-like [Abrus precatorius]|uniref:P34 probable thiol protease-like n=1 Tax=Abrus precatorius TaxID=3816 RepID=A0A8B8KRG5_ABRPR|nr:P34 probable thiol protease-like [Abrus precatorius]